jgi:hypothetical protein
MNKTSKFIFIALAVMTVLLFVWKGPISLLLSISGWITVLATDNRVTAIVILTWIGFVIIYILAKVLGIFQIPWAAGILILAISAILFGRGLYLKIRRWIESR